MTFPTFFASRIPRSAFLIVIGILLISMPGCAKKGPLKPKLHSLPAAPEAVSLAQKGNTLVLAWTQPDKNEDGSQVEDLVGFKIRRLAYPAVDNCPTCREPVEVVAEIDLTLPEPAEKVNKRFYWRDTDVALGSGYRYAITPVTLGRQEGPKALIHKELQDPPPSPLDLAATAGDRQVSLSWSAPSLPDSCPLIGYNLYRRHGLGAYSLVPLNREPLENTTLVDRGLENGIAYEYRVGTVCAQGDIILESLATPGVLITPQAGQ